MKYGNNHGDTNMPKKLHLWASWLFVAAGLGWMGYELVRVGAQTVLDKGWLAAFSDGVLQHKIGELLLIIPFLVLAVNSSVWLPERLRRFYHRTVWLMVVGGLLNGYAWLELRHRVDWHIWCLILLGWGVVFGPLLGMMMIKIAEKKAAEQTSR